MKIDHYAEGFGSIKVPIYRCNKTDCMFHHKDKPTCGLFMPHISGGKCKGYTPILKTGDKQ